MATKNQNTVRYFLIDAEIKRLQAEQKALREGILANYPARKAAYVVAAVIDGVRRVASFTITQRTNVDTAAAAAAYPIEKHPDLWTVPEPQFVGTKPILEDFRTVPGALAITGSEATK